MSALTEKIVTRPYCGESLEVLIDPEEVGQQYIEDCQVCCKPITFSLAVDMAGNVTVSVRDENETY